MSVTVTRRVEIDAGHMLPDHEGKCYYPHGHRYVFEAEVGGPLQVSGAERQMVIDFGRLDLALRACVEEWDHRLLMSAADPRLGLARQAFGKGVVVVAGPPTAEFLATETLRRLRGLLGAQVRRVRVWETPKAWADASEELS